MTVLPAQICCPVNLLSPACSTPTQASQGIHVRKGAENEAVIHIIQAESVGFFYKKYIYVGIAAKVALGEERLEPVLNPPLPISVSLPLIRFPPMSLTF